MKARLMLLFLAGLVKAAWADDLSAVVTHATVGSNNGAVDLSVSGGAAPYTYEWTGPGGFSSFDEDLTDLAPGAYCVTVTDLYCGVATLCITVEEDIASATGGPQGLLLSVYPNPFNREFHIVFDSPAACEYAFVLVDMNGKQTWSEQRVIAAGNNDCAFLLPHALAAGRYELVISDEQGTILSRSIVHTE